MYNQDEYLKQRLSSRNGHSNYDDRCDREKQDADSRLRGAIGTHRANEIIAAIDAIKSRR